MFFSINLIIKSTIKLILSFLIYRYNGQHFILGHYSLIGETNLIVWTAPCIQAYRRTTYLWTPCIKTNWRTIYLYAVPFLYSGHPVLNFWRSLFPHRHPVYTCRREDSLSRIFEKMSSETVQVSTHHTPVQ